MWPSCICPTYILTVMQVSNHYLENCGSCWDTAILCHVYEAKFLSKSRVCNSGHKIFIRALWPLCTLAQPTFLLCCINLKTVARVAETWTLLCHVYEAIFQSKSRVCYSNNKNSIVVLWPFCTCPAYILILFLVSIIILKTVGGVAEARTLLCHLHENTPI